MPAFNGVVTTTVDTGSVALGDEVRRDEIFTAASAKTYPAGTLLARKWSNASIALTPAAGANVGNGTCTAASVFTGLNLKSGNWTLRCTATATNGGTWRLEGWVTPSFSPIFLSDRPCASNSEMRARTHAT